MTPRDDLSARMARPQRHRLLQGFPAVPTMVPAAPDDEEDAGLDTRDRHWGNENVTRGLDGALVDGRFAVARAGLAKAPLELRLMGDEPEDQAWLERAREDQAKERARWQRIVARGDRSAPALFDVDGTRELLVGVLPHTQCVARRPSCGFCTFPYDQADSLRRRGMVRGVLRDLRALTREGPLAGRQVHAIYLGGGTANLAPPEEIGWVVQALGEHLRIADAELTLEGTPHLFEGLFWSHLKALAKLPVGQRRISMGLQTFDEGLLRLMGRERFGDAALVKKLAKRCRALGLACSGDLLFNLPGQSLSQMERDVDTAVAAGLDQICLYHLVLYPGLGTPWSQDPALVAAVPNNEAACEHWLRLRERLLSAGYTQSTLTNFERADVGEQRFRYEVASFSVERTDGLGVGPLSLSTFVNPAQGRGLKLLRRKDLGFPPWSGGDLMYQYDAQGLRLLFLTRGLAKTRVERAVYRRLFGTELKDDLGAALPAVLHAGLVTVDDEALALTPTGMFYADAVVSLFAQTARAVDGSAGGGVHTRDLLRELPHSGDYTGMG